MYLDNGIGNASTALMNVTETRSKLNFVNNNDCYFV